MPLQIATRDDVCVTLSELTLADFARRLRGDLVRRGDAAYDDTRRLWNGMIDRYPALFVRCNGVADVVAAVRFVTQHRLRVSVRGGGHNVAGKALCDDGLVIDLGRMKQVKMADSLETVRVQAGALLGDLDEATRPFGRAVPVGVVSRTGLGGLTLHGGMGWLLRHHGLTVDSLLALEVVTAEGECLRASADQHADLFWALRGGGGNFGIVTAFHFRPVPVPPRVWFAAVLYPLAKAREAIRFWKDFMAEAPEELSSFCVLRGGMPGLSGKGRERQPVVAFLACYSGPFERGEEVIRPLREWAEPVADFSGPRDYHLEVQRLFDKDYPDGRCYYWGSLFFDQLGDGLVDQIVERAENSPSPLSSVNIWALGGAMNRVPVEETAFGKRDCGFMLAVEANWEGREAFATNKAWVGDFLDGLRSVSRPGVYLNFPGAAEGHENLVKGCYDTNLERLQAIKHRYDPDNVWRGNFNIRPACAGAGPLR